MLRVEVADVTAEWAVLGEPVGARVRARRAAGLARPVAGAGARRRVRTPRWPRPSTRAPAGPGARCWCRAPSWPRAAPHRLAGTWAAEALRVAAWRPRLRRRDRPPDDPARGRLAADRRPPAEGLLPRAGDGGPGAQPRPPAAAARAAAPRRLRARAARSRARTSSHGERRVGFVTTPARHHEDGPDRARAGQAVDAGRTSSCWRIGGAQEVVDAAQEVIVAP